MAKLSRTILSPLGTLSVFAEGDVITALTFGAGGRDPSDLLDLAERQLIGYFNGTSRSFDLPLRLGAGLVGAVQRAMLAIPFGETRTYGALAADLGASAQAVGQACGANPLPIIVPCHRVLSSTGLGGYSGRGGVETKVALLRLEGAAGLLL